MPGVGFSELPTEGNPKFLKMYERERVEDAALGMVHLLAVDKKSKKPHTICTL